MKTKQTKKKKKLRPRWDNIIKTLLCLSLITNIILLLLLCNKSNENIHTINTEVSKAVQTSQKHLTDNNLVMGEMVESDNQEEGATEENLNVNTEEPTVTQTQPVVEKVQPEPQPTVPITKEYRLTSYWAGDAPDTGNCTGSGLCEKDFQINDKGWYTYNGYLVLAGATTYLQKTYGIDDWKDYYKYYDIINLIIDGVNYQGIILDTCGASYTVKTEQRLDLFVSNKQSAIDRGYKGNNTIQVWKEE